MITTVKVIEKQGTTYTSHKVVIGKTQWTILVVKGNFNYISIYNDSYGRRSMGKDYKTFDDAVLSYKNPQMKVALLKIEMGF